MQIHKTFARAKAIASIIIAVSIVAALPLFKFVLGLGAFQRIPPIVAQLAAKAKASSINGFIPRGWTFEEQYAKNFFKGFKCECKDYSKDALERDAYIAGASYRAAHTGVDIDTLMSEFGYRRIEAEGIWAQGDEKNVFVQNGLFRRTWWFDSFGHIDWTTPAANSPGIGPPQDVKVKIVGYLSPIGNYGHLGSYDHVILITSANIVTN